MVEKYINNRNVILLLGVGIIGWLAINSFAYLFKLFVKEVLLHFSLSSLFIFWTAELTQFAICIIGVFLLIEIISKNHKPEINLFRNAIVLLLLGQIMQFISPFIFTEFWNDEYFSNYKNYSEIINKDDFYQIFISFSELLKYILIVIIIYLKGKTTIAIK